MQDGERHAERFDRSPSGPGATCRCRRPPRRVSRRFPRECADGQCGRRDVGHRAAERADRHDQACDLQPVCRAHRRRDLRRHLGRHGFQGRQYRRHPAQARSSTSSSSAMSWCAGRAAALPTSITGATASARVPRRPRRFGRWRDDTESNHFGTHEFMRFCTLCEVEPYFAANVGTGSPEEFQQWVEYCNAPAGSTSLADERAANGATIRSASATGASATRAGAAAAISFPKITAASTASSRNGCRSTACRFT